MITTAIVTLLLAVMVPSRTGAVPTSAFSITPLLLPNGTSEPEISIGLDGTMGMVSLQWLFDPSNFGTDLWTWTANVAFTAPAGTSLANIFPALAVDPVNGNLYAVWSDGQTVSFASSTDQGNTWSPPI